MNIEISVGQEIIMLRGCQGFFSEGDKAVLTRYEGASGWWANFGHDEWNVGSGIDFKIVEQMSKI